MDLNQTKPKLRPRSKTDEKTLRGRPVWIDETGEVTGKKGTRYSEVSTTIPFGTGWITAPTIDESGNRLSDKKVKQRLKDNQGKDFITGEKLPVFSNEKKASEYAQWRSDTMFDREAIKEGFPEETFPDLPEDKKEKSKEGETSLKGFIDYLMSPSKHFGTGQYNEGGAVMEDQMQMAFMDEGGIADDGMDVDPVSGNEVPPGSLAEEVRDDIPAQLSEGEYVVPADVVRYYGVKFFEDLRDQAKIGLADMEANGRIGGEPVPAGGPINDSELSPQEMQAIQEMMGANMNEGGQVQNPYLQQQQLYSQPRPAPIDEKRNTTITGINPVENQMPMQSMADGGQVQGYQDSGDVTQPDDDTPPFAKNEFNPAQFGLGYSFMGQQPQQTGTTGTTPSQAPQGQSFTVLYHPEYATNGKSKTFYLPRDSKIYQEYLGRGYTKQMPMTGPAGQGETPTTTDTPVTTDLTGATVTTGSGRRGGGGSKPPTPEKVDYSTYDGEKLLEAFDQNRKTRIALTALGAINPMLALFGQGATRAQEKEIIAAMKAKGIKPPENEGGIVDNITDFVSGLFGKDKEEVKNTVVQQSEPKPEPITSSVDIGPGFSRSSFGKVDLEPSSSRQARLAAEDTKAAADRRKRKKKDKKFFSSQSGKKSLSSSEKKKLDTRKSKATDGYKGGRAEGGLMNKKGKK